MINRNLIVLLVCQLIAATGSMLLITLGGIIGADLAPRPALATLPVSLWIVALALTTVPATMVMQRFGRSAGFSLAALSAMAAVLLVYWALIARSFTGLLAGAALFGVNMAFAQQYRFAAIESVAPQYAARSVSLLLTGSVVGALIGPAVLRATANWNEVPYAGTMLALAVAYGSVALIVLLYRTPSQFAGATTATAERPIGSMVRQRAFIVAVLASTIGYGVMAFVMTATPLSMHTMDGFSMDETANVIRAHVLGMYLPSLVTGYLIDRFGVLKIIAIGAVVLLTSLGIGMSGHALHEYWGALLLLGVGWNFVYIGGTTMLTYTYRPDERFRAQAVNEFSVFGTAALASLLAGTVMYWFGWFTTVAAPLPAVVLILASVYWVRRDPVLQRQPA